MSANGHGGGGNGGWGGGRGGRTGGGGRETEEKGQILSLFDISSFVTFTVRKWGVGLCACVRACVRACVCVFPYNILCKLFLIGLCSTYA